jgi:ABC-2 type transport system permease protein
MSAFANDTLTVFVRQVLPTWRSPAGLVFGMLQPLVFLLLFGPLLQGVGGDLPAAGPVDPDATWQWFVPGVLVMLALFGTTGTGYMLLTEIQTGSHERMLVTPLDRTAMLIGRTLNDVATLVAQGVLIVVVMLPFGFDLHPLGAPAGLVMLGLLGIAVGGLSHALAIACRAHQEAFYMVQSSITFPLLFLSGLMLPLDSGPGWMQAAGRLNPLTYVVDALRALFDGRFGDVVVAQGSLSVLAMTVVGLALGTRAMRRAAT